MVSSGSGAVLIAGRRVRIKKFGPCLCFVLALGVVSQIGRDAIASAQKIQNWDGSRITPVHQIPLKDEFNQVIVPSETNPPPFSSRYTCAPCHDYGVIQTGWHFNTAKPSPAGRPGEPWVWVDERTGTQLPLPTAPGREHGIPLGSASPRGILLSSSAAT